jgi:ketosteroid isomerase-like protein
MNGPGGFIQAHWRAVIDGRLDDVTAAYADSPDAYVFVEGPRWSTRGKPDIVRGWSAYLGAPFRLRSYRWIEGPFAGESGDLGWCGGVAEFGVERGGRQSAVRFRASFVLERQRGRWRIVHEHLSQPAADPYGTGDWLKVPS